jgi:hypothetical protein
MSLRNAVTNWQADQVLPVGVMRYVGALRTYAARLNFFLSVPNTLMIGVLFYRDSTALQAVFPTMYHWVGFILFVVVPLGVGLDRVVLHPAQIIYNAHQSGHESRSPNYRETMENQRRIDALHDRLDAAGIPRAEEDR